MTDKRLKKAVKELKEAYQAVKDYVYFKISNFLNHIADIIEDIKLSIIVLFVKIKLFFSNLYQNIIKYCKIAIFSVCNYSLRFVGAVLKFPVYILNNAAVLGNIIQMKANKFRTKVQILKESSSKVNSVDINLDDE